MASGHEGTSDVVTESPNQSEADDLGKEKMLDVLPNIIPSLFGNPAEVDWDIASSPTSLPQPRPTQESLENSYRDGDIGYSAKFVCPKCGKQLPVITSQPKPSSGNGVNGNETIDFIRNLVKLYKKRMGNDDNREVCSGGLQQYIIKQGKKQVQHSSTLCTFCTAPKDKDTLELDDLPVDVKLTILSYLTPKDLCRMSHVSRDWYTLSSDNLLWADILSRDINTWNVISSSTNPCIYKEVGSELTNKDIYLRCSPEVARLMRLENYTFHSISNMLRSLLPKKSPKFSMFGPGLESSTKGVVRKMMYEDNDIFTREGMFPGENGVGAGMSLKMKSNHIFHMSVLYSSTKEERQRKNVERKDRNRLYNEQTQLLPAVRDLCHTLDGFICVIDATSLENVKSSLGELYAMLDERWSATHVPLLVLSCTPDSSVKRIPCINIAKELDLANISRPWQIRDCVVDGLTGIEEGIEWLVAQCRQHR